MKLNKMFSVLALSVLSTAFARAQNITIEYPNGTAKEFDCGLFHVENGRIWMTEEAAERMDINEQDIKGLIPKSELSSDPETRQNQLSQNLYNTLLHFARMHGDCVLETAAFEASKGLDPEPIYRRLYGDNWREDMKANGCTIIQVRDKCKTELGL